MQLLVAHDGGFAGSNIPEMVRARETNTKKARHQPPKLGRKSKQPVATDRNPFPDPPKKNPVNFVCSLVVMVAVSQTQTSQKW
jgi:hypothetical protein